MTDDSFYEAERGFPERRALLFYLHRPAPHRSRLAPHLLASLHHTPPLHQDRLLQIISANMLATYWQKLYSMGEYHYMLNYYSKVNEQRVIILYILLPLLSKIAFVILDFDN